MSELRDHAMDRQKRFFHRQPGFNFRMTNVQAALLYSQLTQKDELIARRDEIYSLYSQRLSAETVFQRVAPSSTSVNWLFSIRLAETISELALYLKGQMIETRPMFCPITSFPYIETPEVPNFNAYTISNTGISLPTYHDITDLQVALICDHVNEFIVAC